MVWLSDSLDMARFGLLWLRGGKWGERQIVPPFYVKVATTPSEHGPDYGFLWWLNTRQDLWPGSPANAFRAVGAGGNIIFIDPGHDLVGVWRWSAQSNEGFRRVVDSIAS